MSVEGGALSQRRLTVVFGGGDEETQALMNLVLAFTEAGSEIAGLFVEDAELLGVAELDSSYEICALTARVRPLRVADLERQFRVQASQAQSVLQRTAERRGLRSSFRTVRGRINSVLGTVSDAGWLLVAPTRPRFFSLVSTPGSRWQSPPRAPQPRSILAFFDGTPGAQDALQAAADTAATMGRPLEVLLVATTGDALEALRSQAQQHVESKSVRWVRVPIAENGNPLDVSFAHPPALVVLSADSTLLQAREFGELRRRAGCPILVLQRPTGSKRPVP